MQHGAAAQGPSRCHGEFGLAQQPADGEAAAGPARFLPQPGVEIDGQPVRIVSRRRSVEGRCQQCCRILAGRCRKRNVEIERRVEQAGAELQERRLMVVALHEQPHGGEQAGKMVATALPHQGGKVFKREGSRGEIGQAAQCDLVRLTLQDKVTVYRACKALETRSLVARSNNSKDGRSHLLELTNAGKDVFREIWPQAEAASNAIFDVLSQSEVKRFRATLEKIYASARSVD